MPQEILKRLIRSLRIVLVLSIIGSGYNLISCFICGAFYNMFVEMKEPMMKAFESMPEFKVSYELMMAVPQIGYLLMAFLYALSLTGVIMMMKLRKNGWHYYTLAQLLLLLVPVLFVGRTAFNIGDLMMTLLFSAYYFFTLRNISRTQALVDEPSDNEENTSETEE